MANLSIRMMLPDGFNADVFPKLKRTLSAQRGVDAEVRDDIYLLVIKDGTELKAIKGAKIVLDQYGIKLAVPTINGEDEEYIDDGSPIPDYADDCNCAECQAAKYRAQKRREAKQKAKAPAPAQVQVQEQSRHTQEQDRALKRMLEDAVRTMSAAKRRL